MNNENEVMEKAPVLTKKDCVKGAIRWSLMAVTTFNYDTQLAPAVVFGIGPLLRKIYKDDDEYVEGAYHICPDCGCKINFENDGGNGFCINCAPNH